MSLRTTTFFIIAMTLLGLIIVLLGTLYAVLPSYFQRQEQAGAILNTQRASAAVSAQMAELQRISSLLAADSHPIADDSALRALDVDLAVELTAKGSPMAGRFLSLDANSYGEVPADLQTQIRQIVPSLNDSVQTGTLDMAGIPLLVVLNPAPQYSIEVVGRFLDAALQQSLASELKLMVRIVPYGSENASDDFHTSAAIILRAG